MIFEQLLNMTLRNPIFMIILFASIWYVPGILIRRRVIYLKEKKNRDVQKNRINSLYPKGNKHKI